ncbi:3128_t:CDS:2 [Funneliformis mosseae]|uniref:3128_t:CDS:1 n=1 Tax=Funneliformis mosseae TaxID=27381 RepID=A0A9N9BG65_FUNMO|nr:3128_t:CDS:2 [Funneliformis mosseae]
MSGVISEERMGMLRKIQQMWKDDVFKSDWNKYFAERSAHMSIKRVTTFINVLSLIDQKREHDNHQRDTTKKRKDRPEVQDEYETDDSDEETFILTNEVKLKIMRIKMMVETMILIDTRAKVDKEAFRQLFEKIPETEKLKLSSGYTFQLRIRGLFNDEEWKEMTEDRLGIPDVPFKIDHF